MKAMIVCLKFLKGPCQGLQYKEIAPGFGLKAKTVTNMVSDLLKKLGLKNNKELATWAVKHGLDKE
jgi:DNA-binding NarL/FixJ family response regulator